jgi:hypothetical protein
MQKWKKLLPAILVPTAICLTAERAASATDDPCRARPGLTTPPGTHWYYRITRGDHRHCWYLGDEDVSDHPHGHKATLLTSAADKSTMPTEATPPQSTPAIERPDVPTSAETAPSPALLPVSDPEIKASVAPSVTPPSITADASAHASSETQFAARWPDATAVRYAGDPDAGGASNAYADKPAVPDPEADAPAKWPVVTAERAGAAEAGDGALQAASLAGGAMMALLVFVGWLLRTGGRPHVRWSGKIAWRNNRVPIVATIRRRSLRKLPTPTDPAVDLKTSLAELMRDLRRADAERDVSRSAARLPEFLEASSRPPRRTRTA